MLKNSSIYSKEKIGQRYLHLMKRMFLIFMDIISYYFNIAFPLKVTYIKDPTVKKMDNKRHNDLKK